MSHKDAKNKESETRLLGLALMIKEVYIPAMETKKEITHHMGKFMGHIQTSVLQAYGNVSITVPEIPNSMTDEEVYRNRKLVGELQAAVDEWTQKIKEIIEQEDKRARDRVHDTSSGETEFWSQRSAKFNMLFQQLSMPSVKRILNILNLKGEGESYQSTNFKEKQKEFAKLHAQAKDFVKFLTTLERQFKNISRGDLKAIEETLPSLLNGLKLIWTISRHINQNEEKFEDILEAISNEICQKVRNQIQLTDIFKKKPLDSIFIIKQGIQVLETWQQKFQDTKMQIESEITIKRWDFAKIKEIFNRPKHMKLILENFNTSCVVQQEFYAILGNDLKAVTGSSDPIDAITVRVDEQIRKLETFQNDVYNIDYYTEWLATFQTFQQQVEILEVETAALIAQVFEKKLNSSQSAFELLAKFRNIETRQKIKDELAGKYQNVLKRYQYELCSMEDLFKVNRNKPPIPKNMPPNSGSIAWARSIITRIKTPIDKFKTKPEILVDNEEGVDSAKQYVRIAKMLTEVHEAEIFRSWKDSNVKSAIEMLKQSILIKTGEGENKRYKVNFNPKLKVIIREAKFLDRIGKDIPNTIINIALQEKDYMRHVDKLNQLLRGYNSALLNLRPVEKKLLEQQIKKLDCEMDKGQENHNWFSLSIPEYIKDCLKGIDEFKATKGSVLQHANNIEKKVQNIENAVLVRPFDFANQEIMGITEFSEFFDSHREKIIGELVKDYQNIGDTYLRSIEEQTFRTNTQNCEEMRTYYYYWERRIFNAITKMIIRAMAASKALWRGKPLIMMKANYNHPEMSYHPTVEELKTQLDKFSSNILQSAKKFGRWWDGYCKIFEESVDKDTSEKSIKYTFYDELNQNPVICNLQMEIQTLNMKIQEKFNLISNGFFNQPFKLLYDKNELTKMQKQAEKSHSVTVIERRLLMLKKLKKQNISQKPTYHPNSIVNVDYTDVYSNALDKVAEWWNVLGKILADIAKLTLNGIVKEIKTYQDLLQKPMDGIELIKALLNVIAEIKNTAMDMELKIVEAQEQFRVLKMYKYQVEPEDQELVDRIGPEFSELVEMANRKDYEVGEYKKTYAQITTDGVEKFKKDLAVAYEQYRAVGPGTEAVSLDEGLELLTESKNQCKDFKFQKDENVLSETLFDLPISTYPDLNDMTEKNKLYDLIYDIYREHKEAVKDFSIVAWSKLDISSLQVSAEKFVLMVKKLEKKLNSDAMKVRPESLHPYNKLVKAIEGFKISIPFIVELKHPAVMERHWRRIMDETGKDLGDINLKTITLSKVFELELHLHQEKVSEICKEAKEEALNEENISKIDIAWKNTSFEIFLYKKGTEVRGFSIKSPDEIRQLLEDNILLLQSVGASKYSRSIKPKVTAWEADLNLVSDCIDVWMVVQRKWMYLESIFASDDIRMQLPEEAKKFGKTDVNYKRIMVDTQKSPNVLQSCVKVDSGKRLEELKGISFELDRCQKSLTNYLDSKKMICPRFYFISDEDLLQILGSSDPKSIQPQLLKLFDNCKEVTFGQGNKIITHMTSDEAEKYAFESPVKPEGKVEDWLCRLDDEMKKTLSIIAKRAIFDYAKEERVEWIKQQIGMIALVGTQIWWTFQIEDVFTQVAKGNKHAMKQELFKETSDLNDLIALVRTDIDNLLRKVVNTLIILDVHARDIVDSFVRDSIMSCNEFEWESQLRFYWDYKKDDIDIRQCTGAFDFCYEYQGLNGRLVITPLTDRCVMTLTTALTFKLGGAPAGPAGTGKTETVKDLAKALALRCVVTNCGETLDFVAMGIIFSGLIQTGFWGCFDEFNRINVEVLSVVSAQIKTVQNGLLANKTKINFLDNEMRLISSIGIYITMNPGYAGRSELPDNLKALFRPVTMVQPDLLLICENMLMSEGFTQAKVLAKKMTVLYKLAKEQLSKQYHYDFQLRALKSVLVMAGQLKRAYAEMPEDLVLMRALRDMNMPKFVFDDVPLFYGLIQDLFPGLRADRVGNEDLKERIMENMEAAGLKHAEELKFEDQVNKMIQLFETMITRHTTMVVGPTGSGKSVILNQLGKALKDETDIPTKMDIINPKMITLHELYGVLDPDSRDWTDGLLSKIFKEANTPKGEDDKPDRRWIVFDGDVDAVWVENMNSVMDDNRILTLANGDRIRLQRTCAMLFEVFDLQYASPATISRCGMVYVDPKNLGYRPFYTNWLRGKFTAYGETMHDSLKELFAKYIPTLMDRVFDGIQGEELLEPYKMITPRTDLNLVVQLTQLIDAILPEPEANPPQDFVDLEKMYIFCLVWSVGSCIVMEERDKFNEFLKQQCSSSLPVGSLYDQYIDPKTLSLDLWEKKVLHYEAPADKKFSSILVPTVDTTRYSWLLNCLLMTKRPVMFCGDSGTAKTVTVFSAFRQMDSEKYIFLNINFSSRTTSKNFQDIIEENIDKRSLKQYGPKSNGKKMIFFIDDLNMPIIDKYGTQAPNALLKFLVERNQLYQRGGDLELRDIVDCQYVGCMSPVGAGNNRVDPRLMSLYCVFNITSPSQKSTQQIYSNILSRHLAEFPEECIGAIDQITNATLNLYFQCCEKLPRTPVKFHYIFNLRDLSRVYEGLLISTPDKIKTKTKLIRLWRNECMRVFGDRLINETDRNLVNQSIIDALVKQNFKDCEAEVLKNPVLFGDYLLSDPTDEEAEDPRLYEDLGGWEEVSVKFERMLEDYGFTNKPMNLVLFNDALDHLTKIHRIIRFPRGSALLVGYGGSGKQSLTKLATFTAGYQNWTINLVRNYKEFDFKVDLQNLYKEVVLKPRTFMFTDAHVVEEGFLELVNNILTIGMVPGLFPEEEKEGLISPLDKEMKAKKLPETKEFRWQFFVNRCRENMHIVLCMSPAGSTLRLRCRNFPGLVSNTSIDWFFPWPEDALRDVAQYFLKNVQIDEEMRKPVCDHIIMIHQSVQTYSIEFEAVYKRKNFSTPKNYLDFISNYMTFLAGKRKSLDSAVRRLEGGLTTLQRATEDTQILSEELAVKNAIIAEKKVVVEALIANISQKTEIAQKQQKIATEKKAILDVQAVEIGEAEADAKKDLDAAKPALAAAQLALTMIKQSDITEVKALANPSDAIKQAITVAFYYFVKDANADWANVKLNMLNDMKLLDKLVNYDITKCRADQAERGKKLIRTLSKEYNMPLDELKDLMLTKSKAAGGLFVWAASTDSCYDIFKDVEPKRKKAEAMRAQLNQANKELAETEAALAELNQSLSILNAEKKIKADELQYLEDQSNIMTRKLNSASKLITGLSSEQVRWSADMEKFKIDKVKLVGDCLSASSFLSYSGPFNFVLRQKMIFGHWKKDIQEKEIPNNIDFKLETFLTDEVEVSRWASEGLPSDELSIQNGILTNFSSRWPLCIDPQMQAVTWIKEKIKKRQFTILTFNMGDYIKRLEMAIKFGQSVLFEGIDTELDPMIDPVLERNITVEAGVEMLTMGDQKLEYNPDFKMFLTTKIANPNYTPEVFGKTMIINFSVTLLGLRDQLLNEVVGYERPELETQRKQLVIETSANKGELKECEDTLLSELSKETDVPLVDNVPLIATLDNAKSKSVKIEQALITAKLTSENIDQSRESYKGVAKRGAILFFALQGLSIISDMYEYSLNSFMNVFMSALETSKKDNVLQARLKFITEKLTQLVYEFTCMGIFERHKLMFSFQMTTMILDGDDQLNRPEMDFFLKGNTSLDEVEPNAFKWVSENGWKDACKLNEMGGVWDGFLQAVKSNGSAWKSWFDLEAPEMNPMPCGYDQKLDKFQALLVCRIFRNDRCVNAIKNFIIDKMSDIYVKSPPIDYEKIYRSSTEKTPIVFILSPGADPQASVQTLAEVVGVGMAKFKFLALGQGMGDLAKEMIESGAIRGHWVMLQNCHLLTSWLKKLESIIEGLHKPDKGFRLWLTTNPIDPSAEIKFPLGILQRSLKVVTEPPDGLAANIRSNYSKLTEEVLNDCEKAEYKSLVYVLSFFHATIQERKKFGKIGWNVSYDFNDSDFRISLSLISLYLKKAIDNNEEELPWSTLRYLIGEAMYGGRVTDDFDRRVLNTYLKEFLGDFIFDSNQKFFFSKSDFQYIIPEEAVTKELIEIEIDKIPLFTNPGVFGLHPNAEIQYFSNSVKMLWMNTLQMQISEGGAVGGINREEYIAKVASDIQTKLPAEFDIFNIKKKFEVPTPTQVVLLQELERFNILLGAIVSSLKDLKRALVGEIGMSQALDDLASCMFNGFVPPQWLIKAPQSLKNLVNWIEHFIRRYKQYKDWDEVEEPKCIWLSGLHIPESYLTALVQTTCRSKGWALDKSTLYTVVLKERDPSKITKRIEQGTYIQGMYIEGARWNIEKDCLDYQRPKELIEEMPLIQIVPVEANKLKLRGTIRTPVYVTQARRNAMGVGLVFEADLKTDKHISHWVLQGVCCVLNTD